MTYSALIERLEDLVDASSMTEVVAALAEVAGAKADHIRQEWQDREAARAWQRTARLLEHTASRIEE